MLALVVQLDLAHVEHHIGRKIRMRVVHLVQQLLAHGVEVDQASCVRGFGDERCAVGPDLGNGVADVRQVRDVLPAALAAKVAAAALARAFEQMPHRQALCQSVEVFGGGRIGQLPAQRVHQRAQKQRGIGHTPGDHDVGLLVQGIHDGLCAQIGVAKHQALAHAGHDGAVHHVVKTLAGCLQLRQYIVATHHRNARVPARGGQGFLHRLRRTHGVEAPRVADKSDASRLHQRPQAQKHGHHIPGVAQRRVSLAVFLQDGQRQFGQVVAGNELHLAAFDAGHHRLPVVPVEPESGSDAYGICHEVILKPCMRVQMGDNP